MRSATFVGSSLPTRLASVCKEAGRPLPQFSDDDVLDFMVTEAVILKYVHEREEHQENAQAEAERKKFRGSHKDWKPGAA